MTVDAGALQKNLREAWAAAGKDDPHGVLRACSMTLVTLAGPEDDPQELGATLADLIHEHPSRSIVLRLAAGAGVLEGRSTVQCWMPFGRRQQICCEQIEVSCSADRLTDVHGLLLGLFVPDLPVNIWLKDPAWLHAPGASEVLRLSDKVIVDGVRIGDPPAALGWLRGLRSAEYLLADLAWTRLTRWRETVAQAWAARDGKAERARIVSRGPSLTALYLAGWMRSVFGEGLEVVTEREDGPLPPKSHGRIRKVELSGTSHSIRLDRVAPTEVVVESGPAQSRVAFPLYTEAILLSEELSVFGRDSRYLAALEMA